MPYLRATIASSESELVFPNREGRMHSRNLHVNERIRTALMAAGVIVGYAHKCRRCGFKVRRTSGAVTKCPECGLALWVPPVPKDFSIHKLRHTTGTLLSKAGVPIQIIQRVLGHADIKVTEGRYLHHDTRDAGRRLTSTFGSRASHLSRPPRQSRFRHGRSKPRKAKAAAPTVSRGMSRPSNGRGDRIRTCDPLVPKTRPEDPIRSAPVRWRRMCPELLRTGQATLPIRTGPAGWTWPRQAQSRHSALSVRPAS